MASCTTSDASTRAETRGSSRKDDHPPETLSMAVDQLTGCGVIALGGTPHQTSVVASSCIEDPSIYRFSQNSQKVSVILRIFRGRPHRMDVTLIDRRCCVDEFSCILARPGAVAWPVQGRLVRCICQPVRSRASFPHTVWGQSPVTRTARRPKHSDCRWAATNQGGLKRILK